MILVFSIRYDYSTTLVQKWLDYYGEKVVRMNGDDDTYIFEGMDNKAIWFKNQLTGESINLREAKACWWRRTAIHPEHITRTRRTEFSYNGLELSALIKGKRNMLDEENKAITEYISYAVYQSASINLGKPLFNLNRLIVADIAAKHGFNVPDYKIISNCRELPAIKKQFGSLVTKAVSNGIYRDIERHRFYTYTELLEDDFINDNLDTAIYPSMVSAMVRKQFEVRTFFIEGRCFSMAIFSQSNERTKIDFRKYSNNRNLPFKLPDHIEERLRNIFAELQLNCGSVDLIVDDQDDFVFLEINPVGQFGMTSEPCNYNLHQLVAKYLIHGTVDKTY